MNWPRLTAQVRLPSSVDFNRGLAPLAQLTLSSTSTKPQLSSTAVEDRRVASVLQCASVFILHLMIHVALFEWRLVDNRLVHFCSPAPPGIFCLPPDFVQLADVHNFYNEKSESVVNRGPTCSFFFTFKLMLCALKDSKNRMYEHPSSLKLRTNLLYNEWATSCHKTY